jgi:hypothetical protein
MFLQNIGCLSTDYTALCPIRYNSCILTSSHQEIHKTGAVSWLGYFSGFPPRRPGFDPMSGHVGFVVDEMSLGQFFLDYFGLPAKSHSAN